MFFISFICLFYLMVLTNCLTISKSYPRVVFDGEKYEGLSYLDDTSYNHRPRYEKRDLLPHQRHDKSRREFDSLVLERHTSKGSTRKTLWGKFRKLFHRAKKDKAKTTSTTPNYETDGTIAAEMMMHHNRKAEGKNLKGNKGRHDAKLNDAKVSVYFDGKRFRYKRNPRKSTRASALLKRQKSGRDQKQEYPVISYVMRKITVRGPLGPDFIDMTAGHHPKTRSFHPLRNLKSQMRKLNQPVLNIENSKHPETITTTEVADRMTLISPYKFKISSTSPKFCTTEQMDGYLKDLNGRNVHLVSTKLPNLSEVISYSVTEAIFSLEPFLERTPDPEMKSFNHMGKEQRGKDENVEQSAETRSSRQACVVEKIHTAVTSCENKLESKLNRLLDMLKKRFNYSTQPGTGSIVFKPYTSTIYVANISEEPPKGKLTLPTNKKRKRDDKKTTAKPRHFRTKLHKATVTGDYKPASVNESKNKYASKETEEVDANKKINSDLEMLEVYEQILNKRHRANLNNMLSTAPKWTPEEKTKQPKKRHIFRIDARRTKLYQSETEKAYNSLAKKIAYDDYVNGFRHYLDFQKRLNKDNFSDAIKFQAHMHHKVKDIGKFILNKIPQSTLEKRGLLDDVEDPIKTDDGLFRKYFNFLLETSAPKKYYSSQTVSLKPPAEANKLCTTKITTTATTKTIAKSKPSTGVATEANAAPIGMKNTYDDTREEVKLPATKEDAPSIAQMSLAEKMVHLTNIRSHVLDKLRDNLNPIGLNNYIKVKIKTTSNDNNARELAREEITRFKRLKTCVKRHVYKPKRQDNEDKENVVSDVNNYLLPTALTPFRLFHETNSKLAEARPMEHNKHVQDPNGRLPRAGLFKKLKRIFVLRNSATVASHDLRNEGTKMHSSAKKEKGEPMLNLVEILKSLQNFSDSLQPYVFKDDDYDRWYEIDSDVDKEKSTKGTVTRNHPGTSEYLNKVESEIKNEIMKQFEAEMKYKEMVANENVGKYPETKLQSNEAKNSEIGNINNMLEEIYTKPTIPQTRSSLTTLSGGVHTKETLPADLTQLSLIKDLSKILDKVAMEERKKHAERQKENRQEVIRLLNSPTENLSARKFEWQSSVPRPPLKAKQKFAETLYNKGPSLKNVKPKKINKVINPADTDEMSGQTINGNQEKEHKTAENSDDNLHKVYEDYTDLKVPHINDIDAYGTKQTLKKITASDDVNTKLPKESRANLDKQYSAGSFRTQWTTVTKSYDNNEPITNGVDALVKYVSTGKSKENRKIDGEAIIKNALKIMLEKMGNEDKQGLKIPDRHPAYKNKYRFGGQFDTTPYERNKVEKEGIQSGNDDQQNNDKIDKSEGSDYDYEYPYDELPAEQTNRYLTKTKKYPTSSVQDLQTKPSFLNHSSRKKKNYPTEPYYDRYDPYGTANTNENFMNYYIKSKLKEQAATRSHQEHERPTVSPIYRKLQANDFNSKMNLLSEYPIQRYSVAKKPTEYLKDLVIRNGGMVSRENDYDSKYMPYMRMHNRKLDTLHRGADNINRYLKEFPGTTPYLQEVYVPWGRQRVSIAVKPSAPNHRMMCGGDVARRIDGVEERNLLSDTAYALQRAQSEAAKVTQPPIYIDTTLLAYDEGDISFLLNGRLKKEQPRKKSSGSSMKLASEKKTTRPKQFFTTPMPMTTEEFDKFLTDNSLDVGSVTSPIYKEHKAQNGQVGVIKHTKYAKGDDVENAHSNNKITNAHHMTKRPLSKGNKKTEPNKEENFENNHFNLQSSTHKTPHSKVNQPEQHRNDHAHHGKGNDLGNNLKNKEANLESSKSFLNKKHHSEENKLNKEEPDKDSDLDEIQYAMEHLSNKLNSHRKDEHKAKDVKKIHELDKIQHSIEGFDSKTLNTKKNEPLGVETDLDNELENILNDKKNAFHIVHDNIEEDENYENHKIQFSKKELLKKLHSLEHKIKHDNIYDKLMDQSETPVAKTNNKCKEKEITHLNTKSQSDITDHSHTAKETTVDKKVLNKYFTELDNGKGSLKSHMHSAQNNEYHTVKEGMPGLQKSTTMNFFKPRKSSRSSVSKSHKHDNDEDDQEDYEVSGCKICIVRDHKKQALQKSNIQQINNVRGPQSKNNKDSGDILRGKTVMESNGKNIRLFSASAQTKPRHHFANPTTEKFMENKKAFDDQIPKSQEPHPTEKQNQKIKRFRATYVPFFKENFRVVTFANVIPSAFIQQNNDLLIKKTTPTTLHEMEAANRDVKIDTKKITAETSRKIIDKITKDIESMNDQKYGPFEKPKDNMKDFPSQHEKKEKNTIRTKGIFNPEKKPAVLPALKINPFVTNNVMKNGPSKPAVHQIRFSGKSYKYDFLFGDHETSPHSHHVQADDNMKSMHADAQPYGKRLKQHTFSKWLSVGKRISKRSDGNEKPVIRTASGRPRAGRRTQKVKVLPVPEHRWHMSHLWAKCNSSRKKSSKIKTLPAVKWISTVATKTNDLDLPRVDILNDEAQHVSSDYDPRDLQEGNNHERKIKRSLLVSATLKPTLFMDVATLRTLKHEGKDENSGKRSVVNSRSERHSETFTVKNVGSIEVVIELQNYTQAQNEQSANKLPLKNFNVISSTTTPTIHVNLPLSTTTIKYDTSYSKMLVATTPKSCKIKKVFRATFSSPVNLEYQIKTFHDMATTASATSRGYAIESTGTKSDHINVDNGLSPGLYVLSKEDQKPNEKEFVLKPVIAVATKPVIAVATKPVIAVATQLPAITRIGRIPANISGIVTTLEATKNIGRVTLSRDLITGIEELLSKLLSEDTNIVSTAHKISNKDKRHVSESLRSKNLVKRQQEKSQTFPNSRCTEKNKKSNVWHEIKRKLGIRSHCPCKCKLNKPMCAMCAATDGVVTELIFEFDNIAKYMNEHCGEIQNFFILNPKGGKKLRDTVNVLDRQLKDYYKRLKGKCKNDSCCNNLVTYWDKRSAVKGTLGIDHISNGRLNKRSPLSENGVDLDDIYDILADIKVKLDGISGSKKHTPTLSKEISFLEDGRKELNLKENKADSDDMNDILSDIKTKIHHLCGSQRNMSSTTKKPPCIEKQISEINSKFEIEKCNSTNCDSEQLNLGKNDSNKQVNKILSKDLTELYNDLENILTLNVTRNSDNNFVRKIDLLKCLVENILMTYKTTRKNSGFHVDKVKINLFSDFSDDNASSSKKQYLNHRNNTEYKSTTDRKENNTIQKQKYSDKSRDLEKTTNLMNIFTSQTLLPPITLQGSAKYMEYCEVDELKRKGLKEKIQSLLANFKAKHSEEKKPSAEYCVYKNKAYKIARPSKRQVNNCNYVTDNPTVDSMSEESWEEFLKRRTYDDNHGIIIDAALKEIITTDCVSRAHAKINARTTENQRARSDPIKYETKSSNEKINPYNEELAKIDDTLEKEKSIEEIIDFLILLKKILKANNLTESFHKLLTNEDLLTEEKLSPLKSTIMMKKLRKANKSSTKEMTRPLFSKFCSDGGTDLVSTPKSDIFKALATSNKSDRRSPKNYNDNVKDYKIEKVSQLGVTSKHDYTTAVFNANIHNFFTVINVDRPNTQPTVSTELKQHTPSSSKSPSKSATYIDSSKEHTILNEDLKNILSSYGLKEITPTMKEQVTTPKISGFRNLLLTILMYEAINLSKDFQKFTIPDNFLTPNVVAIESDSTNKIYSVPTTEVTKISSIIEISQTKPTIAIAPTLPVQKTEATTKKLIMKTETKTKGAMARNETPMEKVVQKPEYQTTSSIGQTESFAKPNEKPESQTVATIKSKTVIKKPITISESTGTKMTDKANTKPTKTTERLPEVPPQVYPWNIHVYGKKFFVPPFRGSSTTENEDNLKKFLKTFTKPPEKRTSYNMLEKLVQKMVPKKLLWPESKVEMDAKGEPPDITKWAKKNFYSGKKTRKYPVNTSYDYRASIPQSSVSTSKAIKMNSERNKAKDNDSEECGRERSRCLCDIEATLSHILDNHRTMPLDVFERFVKNITCTRYREPPKNLVIDLTNAPCDASRTERSPRGSVKWDWIRDKRDLGFESRFRGRRLLSFDSEFERLFRGTDGVYRNREKTRRGKREVDLTDLDMNLVKLPAIQDTTSNLYVFVGDTVEIECEPWRGKLPRHQDLGPRGYTWQAERKTMLMHDNVAGDGERIVLKDVQPRNMGVYNCSQRDELRRSVKLNVLSQPNFTILFLPAYETGAECHYRDLRAIHCGLPRAMADLGCAGGKFCSVSVEDPVCMKDEDKDSAALRGSAILVPALHSVECSTQCRRDLQCALTMLCATNVPPLASIPVIVKDDISSRKFPVAMLSKRRWIVTHTLRRRAPQASRPDLRHMLSTMVPGDVNVFISCPAGYQLITDKKVCEACPVDTYAEQGTNECHPCPRDQVADAPGSAECRQAGFLGRYDWRIPCLLACVASTLVLAGCLCLCCCMRRCLDLTTSATSTAEKTTIQAKTRAGPHVPPMSPSRVILAKFFRSSPTSSKNSGIHTKFCFYTDCHETKFDIWINEEKRRMPPPLPSIDFD